MGINFKDYVYKVPDYPEPGVIFRDISPLISDGQAYKAATDKIAEYAKSKEVDVLVGPEARGFIVGCPVAYSLGIGFVPSRKKNKLPRETVEVRYTLEYGKENALYMHKDAIKPGQRVLVTDDLLATGGTIAATIELVKKLGGTVVGTAFFIELQYLQGRQKLSGYDIFSLMKF